MLSVCFLIRNEERNLPRALASVRDLAAELLVADTGSTDKTASVAVSQGARVIQAPWDDDFGAARTFLFQQAAGPWILFLNPDEVLESTSREPLQAAIADGTAYGYYTLVRELLAADRPEEFGESIQTRLFRKDPRMRCVGRLHPRFDPSLELLAQTSKQSIKPAAIVITRHAYLSPATQEKIHWVIRLLERELKDHPGQLGYEIEYGRNLLLVGDARGHQVLGQCADRVASLEDRPNESEVARLLEYLMQVGPEQRKSSVTPETACLLAKKWYSKSPPLLWRAAQLAFQAGRHAEAAESLEKLLELGRAGGYDQSEGFSTRLFGEPTQLNLSACYLHLGRLDEAGAILSRLVDVPAAQAEALKQMALLARLKQARR